MIRKAERTNVKTKIALIGPSGGGKTYSSLRLATGLAMGGKIGMIDTEEKRGEYYADEFNYDVLQLTPPFSPERYIDAIQEFKSAGYSVLIIDSASHEWMGRGGIMEDLDHMPGAAAFQKWAKLTPRHNAFIDAIVRCDMHVIVSLRAKDMYIVEENEKGKQAPKKVGVGPQQREGLEYEMTVAFIIDQKTHVAEVVKDNTKLFDGQYEKLTEEHGRKLAEWAALGKAAPPPPPEPEKQDLGIKQRAEAAKKAIVLIATEESEGKMVLSDENRETIKTQIQRLADKSKAKQPWTEEDALFMEDALKFWAKKRDEIVNAPSTEPAPAVQAATEALDTAAEAGFQDDIPSETKPEPADQGAELDIF